MKKHSDVGHNNLTFMRTVVGFAAADWRGTAGVDAKFESENRKSDAF
jgi:hypothetical protein